MPPHTDRPSVSLRTLGALRAEYRARRAVVRRRWRINGRTTLLATAELFGWWAALGVLWLVFISTVDTLELAIGAAVACLGALAARAARRAVTGR